MPDFDTIPADPPINPNNETSQFKNDLAPISGELRTDAKATAPSFVAVQFMQLLAPTIGEDSAQRAVILAANISDLHVAHIEPRHIRTIADKLAPMIRAISGASRALELIEHVRTLGSIGEDRFDECSVRNPGAPIVPRDSRESSQPHS